MPAPSPRRQRGCLRRIRCDAPKGLPLNCHRERGRWRLGECGAGGVQICVQEGGGLGFGPRHQVTVTVEGY
jgi:hypothetical protein